MRQLPAISGWLWIRQGFLLLRQRMAEMATLFLGYVLSVLILGMIPILGQILAVVLTPTFSIAFMQACLNIEQGKRVLPTLLLSGFRSPAFKRLLALGLLYLAVAALALMVAGLVSDGMIWQVLSGKIELDEKTLKDSNISLAMMCGLIVYIPVILAFWFAAPLIYWQDMGVGKAVFFSFFAVLRAAKAFLMYGSAWFGLSTFGFICATLVSVPLGALLGAQMASAITMYVLLIFLSSLNQCAFYYSYTQSFGRPESAAPTPGPV